jgi:hypothetical protein
MPGHSGDGKDRMMPERSKIGAVPGSTAGIGARAGRAMAGTWLSWPALATLAPAASRRVTGRSIVVRRECQAGENAGNAGSARILH